jgi:3-deoxy-D-manno-octulosonate 8-phosphate phosphatase (KDO 8-P phosphatase)
MKNYKEKLSNITTFMFDYDGVMTDGTLTLQHEGQPLRSANVKDGYILQLAIKLGYRIVIISGGYSKSVKNRFGSLKISDVFLGVEDKTVVYNEYIAKHKLNHDEIIYMGDDIPDYRVMKMVGLPVCPSDAVEEIKDISLYISDKGGGKGCVRDIIEQVLKVQGKWMTEESYSW